MHIFCVQLRNVWKCFPLCAQMNTTLLNADWRWLDKAPCTWASPCSHVILCRGWLFVSPRLPLASVFWGHGHPRGGSSLSWSWFYPHISRPSLFHRVYILQSCWTTSCFSSAGLLTAVVTLHTNCRGHGCRKQQQTQEEKRGEKQTLQVWFVFLTPHHRAGWCNI